MNLYQAQEFFKQLYPGKEIKYDFDDKCHRFYEIIITDGQPNPVHHCECNKVKVIVDGMDPIYVPIAPHRLAIEHTYMTESVFSMMKREPIRLNNDLVQ